VEQTHLQFSTLTSRRISPTLPAYSPEKVFLLHFTYEAVSYARESFLSSSNVTQHKTPSRRSLAIHDHFSCKAVRIRITPWRFSGLVPLLRGQSRDHLVTNYKAASLSPSLFEAELTGPPNVSDSQHSTTPTSMTSSTSTQRTCMTCSSSVPQRQQLPLEPQQPQE